MAEFNVNQLNEYQNLIRLIHKYSGCHDKQILKEIKSELKELYQKLYEWSCNNYN